MFFYDALFLRRLYSNGIFENDSLLGKIMFLIFGLDSTFKCLTCGSNMLNEKPKNNGNVLRTL